MDRNRHVHVQHARRHAGMIKSKSVTHTMKTHEQWLLPPSKISLAARVHQEREVPSLVKKQNRHIRRPRPPTAEIVGSGHNLCQHNLAEQIQQETQVRLSQQQRHLQQFQAAVRHRVAAQQEVKRQVFMELSSSNAAKEVEIIGQSAYDSRLWQVEVSQTKTSGERHSPSRSPSAKVNQAKENRNNLLSHSRHARRELSTRKLPQDVEDNEDNKLPGVYWTRGQKVEQLLDNLEHQGIEAPFLSRHAKESVKKIQIVEVQQDEVIATEPDQVVNAPQIFASATWTHGELKNVKERQFKEQFGMYRRLFMDEERERVREMARQQEHERRIHHLKAGKESQRSAKEELLRDADSVAQEELTNARAEAQRKNLRNEQLRKYRQDKSRAWDRYIHALRKSIEDACAKRKIFVPPLCNCSPTLWGTHPDSCSNNCPFHNNKEGFTKALKSLVVSCGVDPSVVRQTAQATDIHR